jgi:GAF domain-containing protein
MNDRSREAIPRLGALCVALGYISQEQLDACLLLQTQDCPGVRLGQILRRCGYITADDLDRILQMQEEIAQAILQTMLQPPTSCTALLLTACADSQLLLTLRELGIAASRVRSWAELWTLWQERPPDLLIVDPALMQAAAFPADRAAVPIWLLPPPSGVAAQQIILSTEVKAALAHFIQYVSERRHVDELLEQYRAEARMIATIIGRIVVVRSADEALEQLMVALKNLFAVEAATLFCLDRATNELSFAIVLNPASNHLQGTHFPSSQGLAGWVARNRQPLLIPNARSDPRFVATFDRQTGFETRSLVCVPLLAFGEVWGVIELINKTSGEAFTGRDLQILRTIGALGGFMQAIVSAGRSL